MNLLLLILVMTAVIITVLLLAKNHGKTGQNIIERWQIMARDMSPGEIESKRTKTEIWFLLAAFTAFFASSFFVIKYMVGGDFSPTAWSGEQWGNALLGLLITAVITAFQYYLYGIDQKTAGAIIGAIIAVFFGLFSEISQSMEREDVTVRHRSESSPVFQAALDKLKTLGNSNGGESYAALIAATRAEKAEAETALAQCQTRYKGDYSRNQCKRAQQQAIASAQAKIDSYNDAGKTARSDKSAADKEFIGQLQGMQYDEQQHYAMIRLIKEWLGVAGIWASFLFSFTIIGTFEYAFHFIGSYLNDLKKALRGMGFETGTFKKQPARSPTGNTAPISGMAAPVTAFTSAADSVRHTVTEYAAKVEAAAGNELMRAQSARNALHQELQEHAGKIGDRFDKTVSGSPIPDVNRPARLSINQTIGKLYDAAKVSSATDPTTIHAIITAAYASLMSPADLDTNDLQKVAEKIAANLAKATPPPTAEKQPKNTAPTMPAQSQQDAQQSMPAQSEPELSDMAKQVETELYPEWLGLVSSRGITPAAQVAKQFISSRTKDKDAAIGITAPEMGRIWSNWQERAAGEGVLIPNPKYQPGNRQPRFVLA